MKVGGRNDSPADTTAELDSRPCNESMPSAAPNRALCQWRDSTRFEGKKDVSVSAEVVSRPIHRSAWLSLDTQNYRQFFYEGPFVRIQQEGQ